MTLRLLFAATLGLCGPLKAQWPQWMGPQRDGVWEDSGVGSKFPQGGLAEIWSTAIGSGYAGPALADGHLYVMDWRPDADAKDPQGSPGHERLLCLDAESGKVLWEQSWPAFYTIDYPSGPRATPTVHGGHVYVLGAEGRLACYGTEDGAQKWARELKKDYACSAPTWGFSGHPLVHGDSLICLVGGEATSVAFDLQTGREKWRALSSRQAGYSPPTLVRAGGKPVLIQWHGEAINALDPSDGQVLWSVPRETRFGVSMAAPVAHRDRLLISAFWWGCKMFDLDSPQSPPEVLWETERESDTRTTHLNALMCTPVAVDDHFYGVCSYGQLRCLEWGSGRRLWETFAATTGEGELRWGTAFLTRLGRTGNRFILFNEKGELILADLTPQGYQEKDRANVIEPDNTLCGRPVVWSHPAYGNGRAFIRNDSRVIALRLR